MQARRALRAAADDDRRRLQGAERREPKVRACRCWSIAIGWDGRCARATSGRRGRVRGQTGGVRLLRGARIREWVVQRASVADSISLLRPDQLDRHEGRMTWGRLLCMLPTVVAPMAATAGSTDTNPIGHCICGGRQTFWGQPLRSIAARGRLADASPDGVRLRGPAGPVGSRWISYARGQYVPHRYPYRPM